LLKVALNTINQTQAQGQLASDYSLLYWYFYCPLVLCVCFVDNLSFCSFSFYHCVVCLSSIYGLWLSLLYLQTLLMSYHSSKYCGCPKSLLHDENNDYRLVNLHDVYKHHTIY
jgi:hypothetical protein